jgi:ATPase subunit of ABC transporter with duplicated ATPase domains
VSHDRLYLEQVCDRVLELTEEGLKEVAFRVGGWIECDAVTTFGKSKK